MSVAGGCQCGAVRYTLGIARPMVYACHCRECQRQSGSAFGLSLPIRRSAVSLDGATACWERATDSGARTACHFCPACGTRIYHVGSASPDWLTLKAGTLDDAPELLVSAHIWTSSKQAWVVLAAAVPSFDTQPADLAAWRRALVEEERP